MEHFFSWTAALRKKKLWARLCFALPREDAVGVRDRMALFWRPGATPSGRVQKDSTYTRHGSAARGARRAQNKAPRPPPGASSLPTNKILISLRSFLRGRLIFFLSATTIATTSSYKSQEIFFPLLASMLCLRLCDTLTDRSNSTKRT